MTNVWATRRAVTNRIRHTLRAARQSVWREVHRACRQVTRPFWHLPVISIRDLVGQSVLVHPPILDDVCMPPYYGTEDHDDYRPLMELVTAWQPRTVLELGTAHGNTVANVCRHAPQAQVFTVNAPVDTQTGIVTTFELTPEDIGRVYRQHGFADRVVQILENTLQLDLAKYVLPQSVDLAIIDACHDTSYVLNDFLKVAPFVRPGGCVLLHDTYPSTLPSHLDGSYRACLRLRGQGWNIRHLKDTWWGVWIKGSSSRQ